MTGSLDDTQVQSDLQREQSRELSLRADRPPLSIKGYTFLRRLGIGAYGSVWLAREDNTGRNVAIKFYTHRRGLDWSLLNREVEKLAVLYTSRNIVGLLDVGWNSDPPYYAMEYLENGSLASWLEDGVLEIDEAVRVATGIAKGLVHAHGSGILHCDLKPANVLFDAEKEPRLCDFGQSRLSHEQNPALGTLFFMAPEQADLRAVPDARWDVYALGALLYQMLTGAPPYRTSAAEEQIRSAPTLSDRLAAYRQLIADSPFPDAHRKRPGVDARLAEIVDRCLATNPADRYPNAQAVLERLRAREQQRARGPLLQLGVLGPLLILAAMVPLFVYVMGQNVKTLRQELTERALESDALTARVQAQSLEDELDHRISELDDVLANPALTEALEEVVSRDASDLAAEFLRSADSAAAETPRWIRLLNQAYDRVAARAKSKDTSWFLTTASGTQIWRRGSGDFTRSLGRNYAFRDYFHGRGEELPRDADLGPQDMFSGVSHISAPFISDATGRYMVAVAMKVRGPPDASGQRPVIGLLGRTTHLDEFRGRFINRIQSDAARPDQIDREIALVDARNDWQLLDHSWIEKAARAADDRDTEDESFTDTFRAEARRLFADPRALYSRLKVDDSVVRQFEAQQPDADDHVELRLAEYEDPVGRIETESAKRYRGNWLAALYRVRVGDADWVVIIQERSATALDSVDDMTSVATRYGLLAILLSIGVILLVWWFVLKTMRNLGTTPASG